MTIQTKPTRSLDWQRAIRDGALSGVDTGGIVSIGNVVAAALLFATYANGDGTSVRPGCSTVADAMQSNASTVKKAVKVLREGGFLVTTREATAKAPAHYRLTLPVGLSVPAAEPESEPQPDDLDVPSFYEDDEDDEAHEPEPQGAAGGLPAAPPAPGKGEAPLVDWEALAREQEAARARFADVPSFDDDDDDEPEPEPERVGLFTARDRARRERLAAQGQPEPYRLRYGGY